MTYEFSFTHDGGTRTLTAFTLPARTRTYARTPELTRDGSVRVLGDALEQPRAYSVTTHVEGDDGTLADAFATAYEIVGEAESAASVTTYEGDLVVNGITGYGMQPIGATVELTLQFAPRYGTITPSGGGTADALAGSTLINAGSSTRMAGETT